MKTVLAWCAIGSTIFATDWTPPENPVPTEILKDARQDRDAGRYETALAKHLWYHEHALEYDRGQTGVRLSFALSDWMALGKEFPPALDKLKEIRDQTNNRLRADKAKQAGFNDFHDLAAINRILDEHELTAKTFEYLHDHNPQAARLAYFAAEQPLIHTKNYELCGEYLDPTRDLMTLRKRQAFYKHFLADNSRGVEQAKSLYDLFSREAARKVALLVLNKRHKEAETFAQGILQLDIDEPYRGELKTLIDKALKGELPKSPY